MNTQRLTIVLTLINFVMLAFILTYVRSTALEGVAPILRTRALEIVDDQGRVRAQLIVVPPTTMPDGQKYAEATLFRLIDLNGRPGVKIGTSVDGSGMSLAGDSEHREWSGVQILAQGTDISVKLTSKDGTEKLVTP
jgi:hypothetical protein